MKKIRNTLLDVFSTFMAWVVVALVCIVPITMLLGCIKLLMVILGG